MTILTAVGVFANTSVVVLFTLPSRRKVHSRVTYLLRSLAVSDGTMALVGGTMYAVNCFYHKWVFGRVGKNTINRMY